MPGGDGTGPSGMGPMTGRAAGYCAGYPAPGYMNPVGGRGYGGRGRGFRGRGGGRGWRNQYYATGLPGWARAGYDYPAWGGAVASPYAPYAVPLGPAMAPEQEITGLKQQAEYLQNALSDTNKRIEQLKAEAEK